MNKDIEKAILLRESDKAEEAIYILKSVITINERDPIANYQCAWCHDVLGRETEAVPYYEAAIENGLAGEALEGAYLGLGSTYRAIGEYEKSKSVFEEGMKKFPDNLDLQVFYAMTLYNLGQYSRAMEILLRIIADTSEDKNIKTYSWAIEFYSDKLDSRW
ncbi:MAG: tetratricopeptide repeat protein [Bacillota bacterium]